MKNPSPAIIISTVALFFSMAGAGFAAGHYLITSTSQIKPSVLSRLRGKTGQRGPQGEPGAAGAAGAPGAPGAPGAAGAGGVSATSLWADVSYTGQLLNSSGVTSVSGPGSGAPYVFTLVFDRDVAKCARVASIATSVSNSEPTGTAAGSAIATGAGSGDPSTIQVFTYLASGTSYPLSFDIAVYC